MEDVKAKLKQEFALLERNRQLEQLIFKSRTEVNNNKEGIRKLRQEIFRLMDLKPGLK